MLEEVFGNEVMSHLSAVARESDDLRELVYRELFQPVWDKTDSRCLGVRLEVEPYRWVIEFQRRTRYENLRRG